MDNQIDAAQNNDPFKDLEGKVEILEPEEKVPPTDSSPEIKPDEGKPSQEGENTLDEDNVPFHKHPRWQEREKEWNEKLEGIQSQHAQEMEELKNFIQQSHAQSPGAEIKVPDKFATLFGENPELFQNFNQLVAEQAMAIISKREQERLVEEEKQRQHVQELAKRYDTEIDQLKTQHDFDVNEFKHYMIENQICNAQGDYNFQVGIKAFMAEKEPTKKPSRRELAGNLSPSATTVKTAPKIWTPETAKGLDWNRL